MIGDLFDNPWMVLILAVVLIVFFGSKKLPGAARSLGQSMRILKKEVSGLGHDDDAKTTAPATQFAQPELTPPPAAPAVDQKQQQIDALQQQIRDLQRAAAMDTPSAATAAEPQRTHQSS